MGGDDDHVGHQLLTDQLHGLLRGRRLVSSQPH